MRYQNFDPVSHQQFVAHYMDATAEAFVFQDHPIQVYPLSAATALLKPPTSLFRAEYNFLLLFSAGGGQQQVDNDVIELAPNDVLFIRDGHLNAIRSIAPDTNGYFIHIDSRLLPHVFADGALLHRLTFYPKHSVSSADMAWLCQCCALLLAHPQGNGPSEEVSTALLKALVLKLAAASASAWHKPNRQWEITTRFKEALYQHFMHARDVRFYAEALAVSENYLNRCVNHITNRPPKQHINELVIEHSKVLLQDGSQDIAQVAFALNFSDPSYFGRLFKLVTKQTPTQYRNSITHALSG